MAEPHLTESLRRELARLALLPDAEIDTSDMPEVTDWSGARQAAFRPHDIKSRGYDVRALANWFLDRLSQLGISVSNLSLNKILYFAVERALVEREILLTPARIEAWNHGPVFREIYQEFKGDDKAISARISTYSIPDRSMKIASGEFTPDDIAFLEEIAQSYGRLSPSQLRNMSHAESSPWDRVWNYRGKTNPGMEISTYLIFMNAPERRQVDG